MCFNCNCGVRERMSVGVNSDGGVWNIPFV